MTKLSCTLNHDPFGMLTPGRHWEAGSEYRYGFNGKEQDSETYGEGNIYDYGFRVYNPRLGKFLSVDPLTNQYAWNSPFSFAENKVIDGLDLDGLEYISYHHYANGSVTETLYYKMSDYMIEQRGGTTSGFHNSVPYGPGGKGVVHYFYDERGNRIESLTNWEMRQTGGASDFKFHGLYSGPGCITYDGLIGSKKYNFNEQPIDWADAIAKRHDEDYESAAGENYVGFLDDVRTLQADKDMVKRIDDFTLAFLNPFAPNTVEGVDTPVRKSYSTEMDGTLTGQRLVISSLVTYKQWKIDNGLGNDTTYEQNRDAFAKKHLSTALILDSIK